MRTLRSLIFILAMVMICSAASRLSFGILHRNRIPAVAAGGDPIPQCPYRKCAPPTQDGRGQ